MRRVPETKIAGMAALCAHVHARFELRCSIRCAMRICRCTKLLITFSWNLRLDELAAVSAAVLVTARRAASIKLAIDSMLLRSKSPLEAMNPDSRLGSIFEVGQGANLSVRVIL